MSVWAIADLHLSFGNPKPMDRFGTRWTGHAEKLAARWRSVVRDGDTVVVPGDISWGGTLEEAEKDFAFLDALPGRKLFGKGNHDFWWTSMKKMKQFFDAHGFTSLGFLYNNACAADGVVMAGTRGWFLEERPAAVTDYAPDYARMVNRECERLTLSLKAAEQLRLEQGIKEPPLVFLHFPPLYGEFSMDRLIGIMKSYGVETCYAGHIHGQYLAPPYTDAMGLRIYNVAADYLNFMPLPVVLTKQ